MLFGPVLTFVIHSTLTWQGFSSGGGTAGMSCVRRDEELPSHQTKPMPAGSKTHSLLAKYKPFSKVGSASMITCLRKGKN